MKLNKFVIGAIGLFFCLNLYGVKVPDYYPEEMFRNLEKWNVPKIPNQESVVMITIDMYGKFDYTIIKKAKDPIFNESLKRFLDKQKEIKYTTYKKVFSRSEVVFRSEDNLKNEGKR